MHIYYKLFILFYVILFIALLIIGFEMAVRNIATSFFKRKKYHHSNTNPNPRTRADILSDIDFLNKKMVELHIELSKTGI